MQHNPSRSPRLSRRAVLRATAAVGVGMPAVVATDALVVTPSWLSRSTFGFSIDGGPTPATATESLGPAARLLQLSDLHMMRIGRLEEQLLDAVNASPPDLMLFT